METVENTLLTLKQVLSNPKIFERGLALYGKCDMAWTADTSCAVLDPEDSEDPGEIPPTFAKEHGFRYILGMETVEDVVSNAEQQVNHPSMTMLVEAFNYYVEFDAFKPGLTNQ